MSDLRIAHISDTHLGYRALSRTDERTGRNQRSIDIEVAFERAIDDLLSRDIDLVIHSGDLFHHSRPAYQAIGTAIRQFRRLEQAGIPAVVIGGNHDTPRLRTSGSVFSILDMALPDIRFVGGYDVERLRLDTLDIELVLVPHGALTNPEGVVAVPPSVARGLLVSHGFIPNLDIPRQMHEPGEEEVGGALLSEIYRYIALGHYHRHVSVLDGRGAYAGSTERIGWGDALNEPGYLIVEVRNGDDHGVFEHVRVPARAMHSHDVPERITMDDDGVRIAENVVGWLRSLDDSAAMARVILTGVSRGTKRHAESLIRDEARDLVWSVQVVSRSDLLAGLNERRSDLPSINIVEQFSSFVQSETDSGRYDLPFTMAFVAEGSRALEEAQMAMDAQRSAEEE
ncbi:hypothetical protein BH23CHL5_BH23CHL5_20830 [soil metagenome]